MSTAAGDVGIDHLVAIICPDNMGSEGVARKLGMTLEREVHRKGGPVLIVGMVRLADNGHYVIPWNGALHQMKRCRPLLALSAASEVGPSPLTGHRQQVELICKLEDIE